MLQIPFDEAEMLSENKAKLEAVFRTVLELPADQDVENIRQIARRNWDSLAQISILLGIESEFGVRLSGAEQERVTSFKSAMLLLEEKGL